MNNELKKYIETVPAVADFVTEKDKRGKNTEDPGCGEVVRVLFCVQGSEKQHDGIECMGKVIFCVSVRHTAAV